MTSTCIYDKFTKLLGFRVEISELREKAEKSVSEVDIWLAIILKEDLHQIFRENLKRYTRESKEALYLSGESSSEEDDEVNITSDMKNFTEILRLHLILGTEESLKPYYRDAMINSRFEYLYLREALDKASRVFLSVHSRRIKNRAHILCLLKNQSI